MILNYEDKTASAPQGQEETTSTSHYEESKAEDESFEEA